MKKIVVTRRGDDFHACLDDDHGTLVFYGKTAYEAVGNLVSNHEIAVDIEVELPPGERHPEFDCPLRRPATSQSA